MLGPYGTGMTKAVAPVTEKFGCQWLRLRAHLVLCSRKATSTCLPCLSTSEYYLAPVLDIIAQRQKQGGKSPSDLRIGMAFENDGFSLDVRAGVLDVAKKYNMKIVIDDKLPADLSDMSATLTKFKALEA